MFSTHLDLPLPEIGLPMAMSLGLLFGMGPCLIRCLPYLGPVFLGMDTGPRQSWKIMLPISLGRMTIYAALGIAAGALGGIADGMIGITLVRAVLGTASVLVGVGLLWKIVPWKRHGCPVQAPINPVLPGGLFLLGIGMGLTPCAPLAAVLTSAAASGNAWAGLQLGLAFAAGAIVVPSVVYGIGVAYFGVQLREKLGAWRRRIEIAGGALLIISGLGILVR